MSKRKRLVVSCWLLVITTLSVLFFASKDANATVSTCTATVSPTSVTTYSSNSFTITIQNTDSVNYSWMKVSRPSDKYVITGAGASGSWNLSSSESDVTVTGSTLGPTATHTFNLTVEVRGGTTSSSENWTVQASDVSSGASPFSCTGTLGTAITSGGSDTYAPVISSLAVSEVAQTSVKITWTTDENSNSVVQYGTSSSYGSTKTDTAQTTSHSVTVDGLTTNTTYHFKVQSTDASSNTAESEDNTFTTSKAVTTTTTTTTVTKELLIDDTQKPGISFTTKFDKPFTTTPQISGKVTDNAGVAEVEYSIDGGANYLPVDKLGTPQGKSTTFSFTLFGLLDGNYKIRVRATDLTGNTEISAEKILVFDRLPPRVGAAVFSLGSQLLSPEPNGELVTIAGLDQKVTLSAIGGPTEITMSAKCQIINTKCAEGQIFSLVKNPDTGLWSGTLSFSDPGTYDLNSKSVDGTGNQTDAQLGQVHVLEKGNVTFGNLAIPNAQIFVYYLEPTTKEFTLWDANAYSQTNPITTDQKGAYNLFLPSGKYYLEVAAPGFTKQITSIFTLDQATPINIDISLNTQRSIGVGPLKISLPQIFQPQIEFEVTYGQLTKKPEVKLIGKELPYFNLKRDAQTFDNFYFRGKPTLITFLNTWLPFASQQIAFLDEADSPNANTVLIIPQESESKVNIYQKLGGYEILTLADPDGTFFSDLNISTLPSHIFVDRKGIVKETLSGVINATEINQKLF